MCIKAKTYTSVTVVVPPGNQISQLHRSLFRPVWHGRGSQFASHLSPMIELPSALSTTVPGCHSIKIYDHYSLKNSSINDLRTVQKDQKGVVAHLILRPLRLPS